MCGFGFSVSLNPASRFPSFFFFFFAFTRLRETNVTVHALFCYCLCTVHNCSSTIHTLKNIKKGSHGTIYTFKNYFATVFSIFSFSNNKFNPNGPYILGLPKPVFFALAYTWIIILATVRTTYFGLYLTTDKVLCSKFSFTKNTIYCSCMIYSLKEKEKEKRKKKTYF